MENKNCFGRQIEEWKKIKDVPIDICITVIINKKDMSMTFKNEILERQHLFRQNS